MYSLIIIRQYIYVISNNFIIDNSYVNKLKFNLINKTKTHKNNKLL